MITRFEQKEFEAALPEFWEYKGFIENEHTYRVCAPPSPYSVLVRSSIDKSGFSSPDGLNSIRAWIVDAADRPYGSKDVRWTTRRPGWEKRLQKDLALLVQRIKYIKPCFTCGQDCVPFKVKDRNSDHLGHWFLKCVNLRCPKRTFEWLPGEHPSPGRAKKWY
jgi:hypothetical protein